MTIQSIMKSDAAPRELAELGASVQVAASTSSPSVGIVPWGGGLASMLVQAATNSLQIQKPAGSGAAAKVAKQPRVETIAEFRVLWQQAESRYATAREVDGTVSWLIKQLGLGEGARFHLEDALITGDYSTEELWRWYTFAGVSRDSFYRSWADAKDRYRENRDLDGEVSRLIAILELDESAEFHLNDALLTGDFSAGELWSWYYRQKSGPVGP